jgi:subtilisin-like proprotein convertase family protein
MRRLRRLGLNAALAVAAATLALAAPALAHAESHLVGSGPLATVLAPGSTVEKSMRLTLNGPVGSLAVWVRIARAHAGDLTLTLVAPDGRTRLLTKRRGGAGAGLGDGTPGCKGSDLVFEDDGYETLDKATPPFTGWVRAAEPLAGLNGTPAGGRWTLRIANASGGVPGTLTCWRLAVGLDVDTTVTVKGGHTTASVTYRELAYDYSRVRLRITSPGASLAVPLAQVNCSDCGSSGMNLLGGGRPLTVRDLDGDGEPEVILDIYTGGAHCCAVSIIFRKAGSRYVRSVAWWGNPGYRLADFDRDGRAELVTADDTFGYLFTSWASSGEPLLVFRYAQGKLTDVTRDFPEQIQADADQYWQAAQEQLRGKDGEPRGLLAAWAADLANLGRWDEAYATLTRLAAAGKLGDNEQMGTAEGAAYVRGLRAHLVAEGYLAAAA